MKIDDVSVTDYHTARRAVPDRQRTAGHADMYGGLFVPGNDDGAHFGVLFWHKDGYSTA